MRPSPQRFDRRGVSVALREIQPDDAAGLTAFHLGLSAETKRRRFFSPHPVLPPDEVERFTCVDGDDRVALVLLEGAAIIAVARYDRNPQRLDEADVAFVVTDAWQGEGLATLLLASLISVAVQHNIARFTADVLTSNAAMMRVFRHSGYALSCAYDLGVTHVEFAITDRAGPKPIPVLHSGDAR
jgi:RimJ/RimL family protein N-acetyltransferase